MKAGARGAVTCLLAGKAQPCQPGLMACVVGTWGQGLLEEEVVKLERVREREERKETLTRKSARSRRTPLPWRSRRRWS
mgnify:CR=1 FL=1